MKLPINKIICGDCLEVMKDWPDNCIPLIVTDPPYGKGYDKTQNQMAKSGRISNSGRWKKYDETDWDSKPPSKKHFKQLFRVSKNQIIWGGNYYFLSSKCKWLVWNKIQRGRMTDGEMAWSNLQGNLEIFDMARTDAYINRCTKKVHPTQKPIELMIWCLSLFPKADVILDPFCGSGTTCVAAKMLGHHFIGIDKSEEYCKISRQRIKMTHFKPTLFNLHKPKKKKIRPKLYRY